MKKLDDREQDSIGARFQSDSKESQVSFILSSSDIGVRRNQGRAGARLAPKAILHQFKKLNHHLKYNSFSSTEVSSQLEESNDFKLAQDSESESILNIIRKDNKQLIHIGGGHDHAYPLLKAIQNTKKFENILIFNIDAHCDTRIDDNSHSGTPFRDFDYEANIPFFLYQYGIHKFANSKSTLKNLSNGLMYIESNSSFDSDLNSYDLIDSIHENCPFKITDKTLIYISLDCDALHSSIMQGVSAVNHSGISLNHATQVIKVLNEFQGTKVFGIYEYNPLFDNLSCSGSRAISYLIHEFLK